MKMRGFLYCTLLTSFGLVRAASFVGNGDSEIILREADCFFNLCNKTEGYPTAKIMKILERNKKVSALFFENQYILDAVRKDRVSRSLPNEEFVSCKTIKSTYFPVTGRNLQHEWKTIVNVAKFKQEIVMEICQNYESSCSASSTIGRCQQLFENKNIMAMSVNGTIQMDSFPIPSGCVCT